MKRALDVAVAAAGLVVAAPVLAALAVAVKLDSPGPALFFHTRVGRGRRPIRVAKLRTMVADADRRGPAVTAGGDRRVTRVGALLRRTKLDELPQLWNVLRGDMSLVGPRPERPQFVAELSEQIPYYGLRHCVKPGMTGWAQLRYAYGASVEDAVEKLKYDMYYAKHHSLMFDALILLQTVEVVLFGKGAR